MAYTIGEKVKEIIVTNLLYGNTDNLLDSIAFGEGVDGNYVDNKKINNQFSLIPISNISQNASNQILFKYNYANNSLVDRNIKEIGLVKKSFKNIVPIMTSNTYPEGLCFAENINSSVFNNDGLKFDDKPYLCFSLNDCGIRSNLNDQDFKIGYIHLTQKKINRYSFSSSTTSSTTPKKWYFEGSNDTTNGIDGIWEILDFVDRTNIPLENKKMYDFFPAIIEEFNSHRIRIVEGESSNCISILNIGFFEDELFAKFETNTFLKNKEKWQNSTKLTIG